MSSLPSLLKSATHTPSLRNLGSSCVFLKRTFLASSPAATVATRIRSRDAIQGRVMAGNLGKTVGEPGIVMSLPEEVAPIWAHIVADKPAEVLLERPLAAFAR